MIDTENEHYKHWASTWAKCRDSIAGQEAVHAGKETYLPRLGNQKDDEYKAYLLRTLYFNASGRTVDGMTGMLFRKAPVFTYPAALEAIVQDVDMAGTALIAFAEELAEEICKVGRVGVLVDYPQVQTVGMTLGQAQSAGLRPYATIYKTEAIIDWRYERINNQQKLSMVKLKERVEVRESEFEYKYIDQIRVLDLFDGRYRVRLFQKDNTDWNQVGEDAFPLMNNAPLREIPFLIATPNGSHEVCKPPLLDLVNVNLSHYRSTADYEHGLHFTGLPTPVFWGAQIAEGDSITIGSANALAYPDPNGHAEYLEFQGAGLTNLRDALKDKVEMMAALGSKILAPEKRAAEAAETAQIHRQSENAILASLAYSISGTLTKMLQWLAEWSRAGGEVKAEINTDFAPVSMDAQTLRELTNAYLAGAISFETYFWNLQQGEVIKPESTVEDERELIEIGQTNNVGQ